MAATDEAVGATSLMSLPGSTVRSDGGKVATASVSCVKTASSITGRCAYAGDVEAGGGDHKKSHQQHKQQQGSSGDHGYVAGKSNKSRNSEPEIPTEAHDKNESTSVAAAAAAAAAGDMGGCHKTGLASQQDFVARLTAISDSLYAVSAVKEELPPAALKSRHPQYQRRHAGATRPRVDTRAASLLAGWDSSETPRRQPTAVSGSKQVREVRKIKQKSLVVTTTPPFKSVATTGCGGAEAVFKHHESSTAYLEQYTELSSTTGVKWRDAELVTGEPLLRVLSSLSLLLLLLVAVVVVTVFRFLNCNKLLLRWQSVKKIEKNL